MEARYFTVDKSTVNCKLCPHNCSIGENKKGFCQVRQNTGGVLTSLNYSKVVALNTDPVEKKPLYHFLPGQKTLSLAAAGCNLKCSFCQNSSISCAEMYTSLPGRNISPAVIIENALKENCSSISFTYSEPTVWYELMFDIAVLAKDAGLKTILVSNGYVESQPLNDLLPYLDAANIDLKAFTDQFYKTHCKATLKPVLNTIEMISNSNVWLEITTLIIESLNSSDEETGAIADFILSTGSDIPWHISRFFPNHELTHLPPGKNETLYRIIDKSLEKGLKYIYAGNTGEEHHCSTNCHQCGQELIARRFYATRINMSNGVCPSCSTKIPGVWKV